jgi:hypothetical protein
LRFPGSDSAIPRKKKLGSLVGHLCRCADNASNRPMLIASVVAAIIEFREKGFDDGTISQAMLGCKRETFSLIPDTETLLNVAENIVRLKKEKRKKLI